MHSPEEVIILQVPCHPLDDWVTEWLHICLNDFGKLSTQLEDDTFLCQIALYRGLCPWQIALTCPVELKAGCLYDWQRVSAQDHGCSSIPKQCCSH